MDMTVTINGTELLAERACRMVFGDDVSQGPQIAAPAPLLRLRDDWPPGKTDDAIDVLLHLPLGHNIEQALQKGYAMGVRIRLCRVTVLRGGRKVGYALRTNEVGLNAIRLYAEQCETLARKLRQAH